MVHTRKSLFGNHPDIGAGAGAAAVAKAARVLIVLATLWSAICGNQAANAQERVRLIPILRPPTQVVGTTSGVSNNVQILEKSTNLLSWRESARVHERFLDFPLSSPEPAAYFRAWTRPKTLEDDWKNQLQLPHDAFVSSGGAEGAAGIQWVKFTLRLDEPGRVYFQDSTQYLFHYPFAVKRLAGFEKLTPAAFDEVSLRTNGQKLVLGAVVFPTDPSLREVGVQIVGREPFPVQQVAAWLDQIRSAIALPTGWSLFYLPALVV